MAQQTINIGASPNDGTGTPLRTAFQYTNSNFSELYTAVGPSGNNIVVPGNATITGDLTVDTSTLKVDSANNAVGVGTASPTANTLTIGANRFIICSDSQSKFGDNGLINGAAADGNTQIQFFGSKSLFFNEGVATRMTLNSTGLGVGGSPAFKLDVVGDSRVIGDTYIFKNQAGAVESKRLIFGSAANSSAAAISSLTATANDGYLSFFTKKAGTLTEQVWIDNNGNTTVSYGNLVMGSSGKGIDFSATASGSGTMTSELLNDYEEGTFTPIIQGGSSAGTGTYAQQIGYYTKVGRLVTVQLYLVWSAHTGTGAMRIAGLPFTTANLTSAYSSATFGLVDNITLNAGAIMTGFTELNSNYINLYQYPSGGGVSPAVAMDTAGGLLCNLSYIAA